MNLQKLSVKRYVVGGFTAAALLVPLAGFAGVAQASMGSHGVRGEIPERQDHVHPTTIGYGIIAEEFLTAMQAAGIAGADPLKLDWPTIIAHDPLIQAPPQLWDDILKAAETNAGLWDTLLSFMT